MERRTGDVTHERAVVLVSGGMDSATAVYEAIDRGFEPWFLHASYGQRTETKERECADALAAEVDAPAFLHVETDHLVAIGGSSLTDEALNNDAVVSHRDEAGRDSDAVPSTYVPFRNANLLSMAVSYAEANECAAVFVGAHAEDVGGYPDTRPAFFEAFQRVVDVGTKPSTEIDLRAPFVEWSKAEVVQRGLDLGVPYGSTWSCYRETAPACGTCDSCVRRLEAFAEAGARDPIEYAEGSTTPF